MFSALTNFIDGGPLSYVFVLAIVALDSFFPVVPGETAAITGGVLSANGDLVAPLVLLVAMAGGMLGDNVSYWAGRLLGARARRRFFCSEKALRRLAWAETQLEKRGTFIIVGARFIPGGRTATTFSAGSLEMPWRRFLLADALAAGAWALYAVGLGFVGGETFQHSVWKPLAIAFGIATIVTGAGEVWRRLHAEEDAPEVEERFEEFAREAQEAQSDEDEEEAEPRFGRAQVGT